MPLVGDKPIRPRRPVVVGKGRPEDRRYRVHLHRLSLLRGNDHHNGRQQQELNSLDQVKCQKRYIVYVASCWRVETRGQSWTEILRALTADSLRSTTARVGGRPRIFVVANLSRKHSSVLTLAFRVLLLLSLLSRLFCSSSFVSPILFVFSSHLVRSFVGFLVQVGYGDLTPTNDIERMVACLTMVCGTTMFSYVIGSVSTLVM